MKTKQNIQISIFISIIVLALTACASGTVFGSKPPEIVAPTPASLANTQPITAVEPVIATIAPPVPAETQAEAQTVVSTTFVEWTPNGPMVEGAESTLVRMEHGLYATFSAVELEPGDAFTLWWIIFNKPENCSDGVCGQNDAFIFDANDEPVLNDDGSRQWNFPAHAATGFAIGGASGTVVDTDGTAEFRAHLPIGDANEFDFGPGLLEPFAAEVHLVIRTHGQVIPGLLHVQLNSPWGGCPEGWPKDPCGDVQIAIHNPAGQ